MQRFMPPDAPTQAQAVPRPGAVVHSLPRSRARSSLLISHKVTLPSGRQLGDRPYGSAGIDRYQLRPAAPAAGDIEATARQHESWRRPRKSRGNCALRDIGGLIVIDFIDMGVAGQPACGGRHAAGRGQDGSRAAHSTGSTVAPFGLPGIVAPSACGRALSETTHINCPALQRHGHHTGRRVDVARVLLYLRLIGEEAPQGANRPRDRASGRSMSRTYLINEKRDWLNQIEQRGQRCRW